MLDRPAIVKYGVIALFISLASSPGMLFMNIVGVGNLPALPKGLWALGAVLFFAFSIYVIWSAGQGRNWARTVVAVMTVLGLAFLGEGNSALKELGAAPFAGRVNVTVSVIEVFGTVMLFLPSANAWYRGFDRHGESFS